MDQRLEEIEFFPRLGLGAADHRIEAGHDLDLVLAAAVARQSAIDIGVEFPALLERGLRGEHQLGGAGGELAAGIGGAGLHQHRPALRRTRDVQRAADGKVFAPMVQRVQLGGVEEDAGLCWSRMKASSSQLSHRPVTTSANSTARS